MRPKRVKTVHESSYGFAGTKKPQNGVFIKEHPDQSSFATIQPWLDKSRPSGTQSLKRKIDVKDRWQSPRVHSGNAVVKHVSPVVQNVSHGMEADRIMVSGPGSNAITASSPINFHNGMIMNTPPVVRYDQLKSKSIIEAYRIATQILEDVAGKTTTAYFTPYGDTPDNYVTPYGPPQITLDSDTRISEGRFGNEPAGCQVTPEITAGTKEDCYNDDKNVERMSHTSSQDPEIDQAQIDRLLFLAGGKSLTDDDDTDDDVQVLASFTRAQSDVEVGAIVNRVLETIASYGFAGKYPPAALKACIVTIIKYFCVVLGTEEAIRLQGIIDQGSLIKNLIIPKDQSQATSRFYATLASRAQGFSRPGGQIHCSRSNNIGSVSMPQAYDDFQGSGPFGRPTASNAAIKPLSVDSFGSRIPSQVQVNSGGGFSTNVLDVQQGVLIPQRFNSHSGLMTIAPSPIPVVQPFPFVPSSMPPPPLPSRIGTARGKTIEEAKKVRDYGFPPLPSSRPGRRAESNV